MTLYTTSFLFFRLSLHDVGGWIDWVSKLHHPIGGEPGAQLSSSALITSRFQTWTWHQILFFYGYPLIPTWRLAEDWEVLVLRSLGNSLILVLHSCHFVTLYQRYIPNHRYVVRRKLPYEPILLIFLYWTHHHTGSSRGIYLCPWRRTQWSFPRVPCEVLRMVDSGTYYQGRR